MIDSAITRGSRSKGVLGHRPRRSERPPNDASHAKNTSMMARSGGGGHPMRACRSKCEERPLACKGQCVGTRQSLSMKWNGSKSNN